MNTNNSSRKPEKEQPVHQSISVPPNDTSPDEPLVDEETHANAKAIAGFMKLIQSEDSHLQNQAYQELEALDGIVPDVTKALRRTRNLPDAAVTLRQEILDRMGRQKLTLPDAADCLGCSEERLLMAAEQGEITFIWDKGEEFPSFGIGHLESLSKKMKDGQSS